MDKTDNHPGERHDASAKSRRELPVLGYSRPAAGRPPASASDIVAGTIGGLMGGGLLLFAAILVLTIFTAKSGTPGIPYLWWPVILFTLAGINILRGVVADLRGTATLEKRGQRSKDERRR